MQMMYYNPLFQCRLNGLKYREEIINLEDGLVIILGVRFDEELFIIRLFCF